MCEVTPEGGRKFHPMSPLDPQPAERGRRAKREIAKVRRNITGYPPWPEQPQRIHDATPGGELLLDTDAAPSDGLELFVFGNEGGWNARLIARLDNLGKGASGAAVQNLNLMCDLPETAGLILPKN